MFYIGKMLDGVREFLGPLGKTNMNQVYDTFRHPMKYKKLLDAKKVNLIVLNSDTREINIIGGAKYSNLVFNPDIVKGWGTYPESEWKLDGFPVYFCDPKKPFVLTSNPMDNDYDINTDEDYAKLKQSFGLPKHLLKLTCDLLGTCGMTMLLDAFGDRRGSVVYMIFGMLLGSTLWFLIFLLIGLLVLIL